MLAFYQGPVFIWQGPVCIWQEGRGTGHVSCSFTFLQEFIASCVLMATRHSVSPRSELAALAGKMESDKQQRTRMQQASVPS